MTFSLKLPPPSEWRIMTLVWRHGPLTVNEARRLAGTYSVTTVATFLRRLVKKGFLSTTLEPPPPGGGRPPERFHPRIDHATGVDLAVATFLAEYLADDREGLAQLAKTAEETLAAARKVQRPVGARAPAQRARRGGPASKRR